MLHVYSHRAETYKAGVSRAGARTGLQLLGHGDMQRLNSSSLAANMDLASEWIGAVLGLVHTPIYIYIIYIHNGSVYYNGMPPSLYIEGRGAMAEREGAYVDMHHWCY